LQQSLGFDIATDDLIKVGLAVLCGGLLGVERQYKNKTAGFRTIIVICLGATIFTMVAQRYGGIGSMNIVTGVGFIGAGVIFKDDIGVTGLTTAAVIWVSAAIGMALGSGNYTLGLVSTIVTLVVLILFNMLEGYIDKVHKDKLFVFEFTNADLENLSRIKRVIESHRLSFQTVEVSKKDGCLQVAIWVTGHKDNIYILDEQLLNMPEVKSF
jgi:putative Mg2+ transporter-C (MgtC) family protein